MLPRWRLGIYRFRCSSSASRQRGWGWSLCGGALRTACEIGCVGTGGGDGGVAAAVGREGGARGYEVVGECVASPEGNQTVCSERVAREGARGMTLALATCVSPCGGRTVVAHPLHSRG